MAEETETETASGKFVERGVSFDQDGKSNVWAIEPKVSISTKSEEEKQKSEASSRRRVESHERECTRRNLPTCPVAR